MDSMARVSFAGWTACAAFALAAAQSPAGSDPRAVLDQAKAALAAGDYKRALARAEEAAALFHARKDPANEAAASNVGASAQLYSGDYEPSIREFQHALALDRQLRDGKGEITRLSNIGNVYFFQGKYLDALDSYEQAMHAVEQSAGAPWIAGRRQLVLTNLATLYEQLGQNETALGYYRQALAAGAGLPPSEYAQLLSNAGTLYRRLGDAVKALEMYDAAKKLFSREHLSDGEIHVLQNVGLAEALDFNDWQRALKAFTSALRLAQSTGNRREIVLAHLFRGELLFRSGQLKEADHDFSVALGLARDIGAIEEQWTALYGLGRIQQSGGNGARALADYREALAVIESVRSGLGSSSSLKTEFLANKREVYDAAIGLMLEASGETPERLFGMFEKARSRNLQDSLSAGLENGPSPRSGLQSVQSRLLEGSLLIEYWITARQVAAVWATRQRAGIVRRELTAEDSQRLREFGSALSRARDSSWRTDAAAAGAVLLDGIPLKAGVAHVIIVPDGILCSIPFEALSDGPSGSALIERFPVSYLPSAALLMRKQQSRMPRLPWQRQLIAFGDPVPDSHGSLPADEQWTRLPESQRELRSVARALPGAAAIHMGEGDRKQYLFNGDVTGVPVLHFSTHATADVTDPNRSRMLFTAETGKKGSEYLFRREVAALRLTPTELVTLSACDTEGGKLSRGEGVQSFSRAFLAAGAHSTVTTLWRVADGPTADFMRTFYLHLGRGEAKAEALRRAKLSFLRSPSSLALPVFWAAFVLNGDGESSLRPVASWMLLAVPAFAVLLCFIALYRRLRRFRQIRCLHPDPGEAVGLRH
jgi:CHAT domain-containing protein/tetratricopeptide (TPR) repeat protein